MWTRLCDCISFSEDSQSGTNGNNSTMHYAWYFLILPSFRDVEGCGSAEGRWFCYYFNTTKLLLCKMVDYNRTLYEDCAVSHNPNREGRLHFHHSLRVRSWSNASLFRVKDWPCLKINKRSNPRFGYFNNSKFFRTEVCNIKAPWFTSSKSANCFKLGFSTSAVACIRAHRHGCNLHRQHLRLQLDVDFFSSRLHAKLIR